jgi:hypothetical protein
MIKLALLAYVITATIFFELAAVALVLTSVHSWKNGRNSVERINAEPHQACTQFLAT